MTSPTIRRSERELLTTVLEETDRMNRLVGNLMDLSKIRAGALVPAREPAAIDEIVDATVARMRPRLTGVVVRLNVRPDLPEVFVDPVQIDQVLTNLLENAAAHSPAGGEVQVAAPRSATRSRSGSRTRAPGSRRPNASACSRRSTAATRRRSGRGAASGSPSRRRSSSRTAAGSGSKARPAAGPSSCSSCR